MYNYSELRRNRSIVEQWIGRARKASDIEMEEYQRQIDKLLDFYRRRTALDGWAPQIVTVDDPCATETDYGEVSRDDLEAILNGCWLTKDHISLGRDFNEARRGLGRGLAKYVCNIGDDDQFVKITKEDLDDILEGRYNEQ